MVQAVVRGAIGRLARAAFWISVGIVVGNALAEEVRSQHWLDLLVAVAIFPVAYITWPFSGPPFALAWPWPDGTTLVPVLVAGLLAYLVSVTVGGRPAIRTWGSRDG